MKRDSRQLALFAFALLLASVIGCKMSSSTNSTSNSSNSNSNDKPKNSNTSTTTTPAAPAHDIAGKYNVVGSNPEGGQYKGTLEVIMRGDVYQFRWNAGTQYDGVGVQNGNIVAVAFANGENGKGCGVVDYDIASNGSLN